MGDEYTWPEAGGKFFTFKRTRDDAYTWMRQSLHEYAYMYRESAEVLMEKACNAPGLLNVHAIPAVYLFRHFVELSLKDLLVQTGRLNDKTESYPDKHRLEPLWQKLRALLDEADLGDSDDDRATLDVVDDLIRQLDTADPSAMAFRYPVGTQRRDGSREVLLSDNFEYFDMRTFRDQAERLAHFLEGCGEQVHVYLEIHDDLAREYQDFLRDETRDFWEDEW